MEKKWFGVTTFTGYEQKVITSLKKQIEVENLSNLFGEIFLPTIKRYTFTRKKLKLKEELLYPGYIFVEMENTNDNVFFVRGIQYVTGYAGIDSMREKPSPLDDGEIETIFEQTKNIQIDLEVGDVIRVVNHELYDGQELVISAIDVENEKIQVRVDALLGDDYHNEEISFTQVEKR